MSCCTVYRDGGTRTVPDFSPDSDQNTFSLEEELLWTRFRVKNILMLDLSQLLSSPDVN